MDKVLLDVKSLSFSYTKGKEVISDVHFSITGGQIVGLIGPNGSGKSTLIKLIFDVLATQKGTILINGSQNSLQAARLFGVYLASNENLPEFLTGEEYIALLHRLYGKPFDTQKVEHLFGIYGMGSRHGELIENYSHGMRKKTQLISAFALDLDLIVIDETLNGIDLESQFHTEKLLLTAKKNGAAILLCTHDFSLLEKVAERIIMMDNGRVVHEADIEQLHETHGTIEALAREHYDQGV